MDKRLGPTFHRTFSLIRPGLSHVLRMADQHGACTKALLRIGSPLGPEQINAMLRYAYGTRLTDSENRLTPLGKVITRHDPNLESQQTLWILHYLLTGPNSLAPAFWPHVVRHLFRPESEVTTDGVSRVIFDFCTSVHEGTFSLPSARDCATALLGTYSDDRSMGSLGILNKQAKGTYIVNEPQFPSLNTFAYVLADFWDAQFQSTVSTHLSAVTEGLTPIFLMGSAVLKQALGELQGHNLVRVQQRTSPYQVEKLWSSTDAILQKVYE